jgi:hypothetical protein
MLEAHKNAFDFKDFDQAKVAKGYMRATIQAGDDSGAPTLFHSTSVRRFVLRDVLYVGADMTNEPSAKLLRILLALSNTNRPTPPHTYPAPGPHVRELFYMVDRRGGGEIIYHAEHGEIELTKDSQPSTVGNLEFTTEVVDDVFYTITNAAFDIEGVS